MARFVFAFESLKKFRADRLLMAKREMAKVEEKLALLHSQLRHVIDTRSDLLESTALLGGYAEVATIRMRRIEKELAVVEEELDRHKSWVTHLGRELKIVEKLEAKKREQFEAEVRLKEKRTSDNWVTEAYGRRESAKADEPDNHEGGVA